jgi:hypothetical protein
MVRRLLTLALLASALVAVAAARGDAPDAAKPPPMDPRQAELLRFGGQRYEAYVRSELASLADRRAAGDRAGAAIHAGRVAPALAAGRDVVARDPRAAVRAAARLLSADARRVRSTRLLDVESRVAGAALAFDGVRDALWARDKGLTGSIDERLTTVRAELDRHRRGERFARSVSLAAARRLGAALDAYAWRLSLAAERVGRSR